MSLEEKLKKLKKKDNLPFLIIFALYFVIFFAVKIAGDDALLMSEYRNLTWADHWQLIQNDYFNWSSRVLVNFVIHFLLGKPLIIFTMLNAVFVTIFAKTLSKLFGGSKDKLLLHIGIIFLILIYPIYHLGTAGWVVTMMTYFWPMVFGFVALIPIKKILDGEKFKAWEYVGYSLALIYAANEEIKLIILLLLYLTFCIYFVVIRKKHTLFAWFLLLLTILSLIFTITTPGNGARSLSETSFWFPTYTMLDMVDKLDIGFFAIMQSVMFDNHLFVIFVSLLMTTVIVRKYKNPLIRAIGFFPSVFLLVFGPLKMFFMAYFPTIDAFALSISKNGLVTISGNTMVILAKYVMVIIFSFCFATSIMLCLENLEKNLFALTLLIAGVGSRVAMGFSPTVYASGMRTATPLFFSIIAIGVMIFSQALDNQLFTEKEKHKLSTMMTIISVIAFIASVVLTHVEL